MATRTGRLAKPDRSGQYVRQLGWKRNSRQQRVQHKFRLGSNRREAESRDELLRKIWEQIESENQLQETLWDEFTLEIAKAVSKGIDRIPLAPFTEDEPSVKYARRLQSIQDRFPFLKFKPTEEQRYAEGIGENAYRMKDIVLKGEPEDHFKTLELERLFAPPLKPSDQFSETAYDYQPLMELQLGSQQYQSRDDGATLHQAMEHYEAWIREHYFDIDLDDITKHAHTKIGQVHTLKSRHEDVILHKIDYNYIEGMYRFWRQRPDKTTRDGRQTRISRDSIRHYIGELHRFFKWLHRSGEYTWRKRAKMTCIIRTSRETHFARAKENTPSVRPWPMDVSGISFC